MKELEELEALLQKKLEVEGLRRMGAKSNHDVEDTHEKTPAKDAPPIHTTMHVRRDSSGKIPCPDELDTLPMDTLPLELPMEDEIWNQQTVQELHGEKHPHDGPPDELEDDGEVTLQYQQPARSFWPLSAFPLPQRRSKKNEDDVDDDEQDEDEQEAESPDDGEDDGQDDDAGDDKGDDNAGGRTRKAVGGKVTPKSKAKPKAKVAVSKSRAKAKACPKKTATEKASSSCEKPNKKDKKPKSPKETKQRDKELMKRKSKAYHRGKAEAIRNGATEEEAKEAGRKAC
eukprot:s2252_g16.t1